MERNYEAGSYKVKYDLNGVTSFMKTKIAMLLALVVLAAGVNAQHESPQKYHGHMAEPKLNYDSLFQAATILDESKVGQTVVKKLLEAYGGEEHLQNLKAAKFTWRMKSMMAPDSITVVKSVRFDRHYKIQREVASGWETRCLNGPKSWFQTSDTAIEITGGRYKSELFSYLVLSAPATIVTEPFSEIRYGQRTNQPYHYIYMKKNDSLMLVFGIDPAGYMIKTAEGIVYEEDNRFVFQNEFAEHQKYEGFFFPYKLTNISMGLVVGTANLESVEVNPSLADDFFTRSVNGE